MAAVPPPAVATFTLYEFAHKYIDRLLSHDGTPADIAKHEELAAEFAITGYLRDTNQQASVNALENPFDRVEGASQLRDYDSLIGFVPSYINLECEIWIHPIPNPDHTLTANIHLKVPFMLPGHVCGLTFYHPHDLPLTTVLSRSNYLFPPSLPPLFYGAPLRTHSPRQLLSSSRRTLRPPPPSSSRPRLCRRTASRT